MRVPPCRSWWQVCLSCGGRRTLWWSRPCLERFCRCRPCHASSWLLSTSCSVSQRLSSLLHVCDRRMGSIVSLGAGLIKLAQTGTKKKRPFDFYPGQKCGRVCHKYTAGMMITRSCHHFLSGRFPHIFPADPEPHQRDLPALPHPVLRRRLLSGSLPHSAGVLSFWG